MTYVETQDSVNTTISLVKTNKISRDTETAASTGAGKQKTIKTRIVLHKR